MDEGRESLPEDGLDVILSGRESTVRMSDVSRGICVVPDLLPVVMSTDAREPLAVPMDITTGRVMKSVDPDVRSGDPMLLKTIPGADGDAYHSEWREMVLDDVVMEKFVLVPEVCPVGSMMSVAEPTILPALSEVYSPVFLAGGGGGVVAAANPLAVVESDTA